MLHVILYQPEIPPNTGNIIRLCANTGAQLHLVEPLGFQWDHSRLKRAGLDYAEWASVERYLNWEDFLERSGVKRIWAYSRHATHDFSEVSYEWGDGLLFGPETRGLPDNILQTLPTAQALRIPMQSGSRSLNLSNSVAVGLYEAWRQLGYKAMTKPDPG